MSNTLGFTLELARSEFLWTLLLLVPILYYFRRSLSDFPLWQRIVSFGLRSMIIVSLCLALAGLSLLIPTTRQYIIFVIDQSKSIDEKAKEKLDETLKAVISDGQPSLARAQSPDETTSSNAHRQIAYLNVAQAPSIVAKTREEIPAFNDDQRLGTNLSAGLETALAAIPPGYVPHIVLATDGRETIGSSLQAITGIKVPISTIPLSVRPDPEVQVAEVLAPAEVRQGEPFNVEVVLASNKEGQGYIDVYRGDILINAQQEPVRIKAGQTRFRFRQSIDDESQTEYAVRIRGFEDTLLDNNVGSALVFASGKPSLLLIDSDAAQTNHFRWALEEQDISVQIRPIEGIPRNLSELQKFDCLMLSNVPATAMTLQQMEIIRTYVEDLGGGLIMVGGDQSFGLGGYYKTTLEEILPIRSNFEKEKEKPSLAMVLVIDKSGSMGGQKMELAKDAAKGAAELLGPRDQLGVIAFDGESYWVSELHSASDKGYIIDRISTIEASGGTNIYPGLSDAYEALVSTTAKLKHVILLTDGHSSPGDFDGIANDMVSNRITLSSVAVGAEADQDLLERLAQTGGGRYYMCEDPGSVPQIFAKETVEASKSAINETPFVPMLVRPTPVLSNIDWESAPFLLGYVMTRPKPTSEFILASEAGDPILVWWRYGLGMTVAFTSDMKTKWASEWINWPEFGTYWAQIIRHAMRKSDAKGAFVEVARNGNTAKVTIDSADEAGRFVNQADVKMTVITPHLKNLDLTLTQTAPGRYEAEVPVDDSGAYHLEMSQQRDGVTTFRQTRGLVVGYSDELRLGPINEELLKKISEESGGHYNPTPEQILDPGARTALSVIPLWPYLLSFALALLVIDVALRRIDLSHGIA